MRLLDGGIVAVGELRDLQDWPRWGIESDRSGRSRLRKLIDHTKSIRLPPAASHRRHHLRSPQRAHSIHGAADVVRRFTRLTNDFSVRFPTLKNL